MNNAFDLKIGFNSPSWPPEVAHNGIVTYLNNLLVGLNHYNVRPIIFSSKVNNVNSDPRIESVIDLKKHPIKHGFLFKLQNYYNHKNNITRFTAQNHAQYIHHTIKQLHISLDIFEIDESFGCYTYLQKLIKPRLVVRLHGPWFLVGNSFASQNYKDYQARTKLEGIGLHNETAITSPSKFVLESLRDFYSKELLNAQVIPNPIAPCENQYKWKHTNINKPSIVFVGRFDTVKGGDLVIDAFRQIGTVNKEAELFFIGSDVGVYKNNQLYGIFDYINHFIPEKHIRNRIHFLGILDSKSIKSIRKNSTVSIVASRFETFSYALIEGMSQGCPVIAPPVGGIGEIIENRKNGLLCDPESSESIAQAVCELLDNENLQKKISKHAIECCERKYHPLTIAKQTLQFYQKQL